MAENTNPTNESAIKLIKKQKVICPKCSGGKLISRYTYKNQNTEYKCKKCGEIYRQCKMI